MTSIQTIGSSVTSNAQNTLKTGFKKMTKKVELSNKASQPSSMKQRTSFKQLQPGVSPKN